MDWPGEQRAWDELLRRSPGKIERDSRARFDSKSSAFALHCLGQQIEIALSTREIRGRSDLGRQLVGKLGRYSHLSVLNALLCNRDLPPAQKWVRPTDLPNGGIFARGTHVLPLRAVSTRFDHEPERVTFRAVQLGGHREDFGDFSIRLHPVPRVPVVVILWKGDDEFPARASLLFDAACHHQLPTDILWSTAMMTILMLLDETDGP